MDLFVEINYNDRKSLRMHMCIIQLVSNHLPGCEVIGNLANRSNILVFDYKHQAEKKDDTFYPQIKIS